MSDPGDTTATIDYTATYNDDTNVTLNVYPTGTTTGALSTESLTLVSGSIEVTGLTELSTYDIVVTSDLITSPQVIGSFTTIATAFRSMSKPQLVKYIEDNNLDIDTDQKKELLVNALEK